MIIANAESARELCHGGTPLNQSNPLWKRQNCCWPDRQHEMESVAAASKLWPVAHRCISGL